MEWTFIFANFDHVIECRISFVGRSSRLSRPLVSNAVFAKRALTMSVSFDVISIGVVLALYSACRGGRLVLRDDLRLAVRREPVLLRTGRLRRVSA